MGTDPIIVLVRITALPSNIFDPMPDVWVTFDNDEKKLLPWYYQDELSFSESEFIGLTENEARELRRRRDINYLRS